MAILSYIRKLDYYSESYRLQENLQSRDQTILGALITIFILIATLIISFMFGSEIYERKDPNATSSKQYSNESIVYMDDLPIVLSFVDPSGENINGISEYIDSTILQFGIAKNKTPTIDDSLKFVKCTNVTFNTHNNFVKSLSNRTHDYYCINHTTSNFFKNFYTEPDSQFINYMFSPCNPEQKVCPEDVNQVLSNLYVTVSFINSYFDHNNKTSPIQYYEYTYTQQISNKLNKIVYFSFNNNKYITDNGWILESNLEYNYTSLQNIKIDVNPINADYPTIFEIILESPKINDLTKRNYLKIQELIAKVGGLVKGFNIAAIMLTQLYFSHLYKLHIINLSLSGTTSKIVKVTELNNEKILENVIVPNFNEEKNYDDNFLASRRIDKIEECKQIEKTIKFSNFHERNDNQSNIVLKTQTQNALLFNKNKNLKINNTTNQEATSNKDFKELVKNYSFSSFLKALLLFEKNVKHKEVLDDYVSRIVSYSVFIKKLNQISFETEDN